MPLHPSAEMMIAYLADAGVGVRPDSKPAERRAAMRAMALKPAMERQPVFSVDDRTIDGPGGPIPLRVYRPSDRAGAPVLVWFHGGGWVVGDLDTHDQLCRQLCDAAEVLVVSVDYRLAPETKFPGAVDDCVAAYAWVTEHAAEVGGDAARVAIGGDSAGGNLAAVVALVARESGLPMPRVQVLVYPVTDYEFESPSMVENAQGYFLERDGMRWFFGHYVRTEADFDDWRFSPMRASSLAGLPRAVVVTTEYDPLRDQGERYGERLRDAGVPTDVVRAEGLIHGFFGLHAFMPPGKEAWDTVVGALRDELGGAG